MVRPHLRHERLAICRRARGVLELGGGRVLTPTAMWPNLRSPCGSIFAAASPSQLCVSSMVASVSLPVQRKMLVKPSFDAAFATFTFGANPNPICDAAAPSQWLHRLSLWPEFQSERGRVRVPAYSQP